MKMHVIRLEYVLFNAISGRSCRHNVIIFRYIIHVYILHVKNRKLKKCKRKNVNFVTFIYTQILRYEMTTYIYITAYDRRDVT